MTLLCAIPQGSSIGENTPPTPEENTLYRLPKLSPWLRSTVTQINKVLELPEDWNSYGASAIDFKSAETANQLCSKLAQLEQNESPQISASADGNIVVCWYVGALSLEIEAMPNGFYEFIASGETDDEINRDEAFALGRMADYVIDWLSCIE